jgi:hypothetical protein
VLFISTRFSNLYTAVENDRERKIRREQKSVNNVEDNRGNFLYWSRTAQRPGIVSHALSSFFARSLFLLGRRKEEREEEKRREKGGLNMGRGDEKREKGERKGQGGGGERERESARARAREKIIVQPCLSRRNKFQNRGIPAPFPGIFLFLPILRGIHGSGKLKNCQSFTFLMDGVAVGAEVQKCRDRDLQLLVSPVAHRCVPG